MGEAADEVDIASEFRYRDPVLTSRLLCVGVSQSGETLDTSEAMREASRLGAKVLVVSNVVDSSMARAADGVLYTRAGPEIGVASTKCHLGPDRRPPDPRPDPGADPRHPSPRPRSPRSSTPWMRLPSFPDRRPPPGRPTSMRSRATGQHSRDFFFLGRHVGYPMALEGRAQAQGVGLPARRGVPGEAQHGPIALIEPGTIVVGIATRNRLSEKLLSNIAEVHSRGATVVLVADDGDDEVGALGDHVLWVPPTDPLLSPVDRCHPPAAAGLPSGHPARPRRGSAPQPGQDGDGR